jgi:GNAT superfamily N-acetyltransferase
VALARTTVDAIYERYAATYAELHAARPELVAAARQEPREDLEDYAAEGGLFSILVDERWAGLAAVFRANEYGLRGYCVGELVLTAEARGRGFARSIQQRLAHALDDRGDDVLFGHIHPINVAAQRSARAAGRHDVGGMLWMPCG